MAWKCGKNNKQEDQPYEHDDDSRVADKSGDGDTAGHEAY